MEYWIKVEPDVNVYVNDINPLGRKTILFIHGWPANHKMFEYQYNYLMPLGYRCIGMDMRGFGNSDKPLGGYDYNRLADDIRCVIEALGLRDITLGGHSTGGAVTIRYMARHNGYGVSKLALFASAAPSLIQRPGFPYGSTQETVEQIIKATYRDRPKMLRDFGELFFYQKVSQPFSDWFFQLGLQAASWSTIAVSKAWLAEELFYDLAKVQVPTLILHGIHDQVCLYPLAVAQHQGIRNSVLVPFENSGHGLFYDEREKFNRELSRFVG
ncbi:alpha/beta fold hydrolase [Paenibacillus jilunlii]|uniref:Alpha/beta hydrolase n=1 Tax=Paenibacillus jilunlii TaxID=682956 RepID=A0A1G9NNE8_9BACL|nr:alpha/beta hydrolase [Paenibacillus jilunlii]KWX77090.1 alpha/beta hydrolase [Paenibacillus jilunlii]SDL87557.1 Pimeloyl-ACP methyl ester carboxylesterase [Paenibacillus jilunlii]